MNEWVCKLMRAVVVGGPNSPLFPTLNHHGCHKLPACTQEVWFPLPASSTRGPCQDLLCPQKPPPESCLGPSSLLPPPAPFTLSACSAWFISLHAVLFSNCLARLSPLLYQYILLSGSFIVLRAYVVLAAPLCGRSF